MGYRKISHFLNRSGIKTQRNKSWTNSSVHSVLKRKNQREERINNLRKKKYKISMSDFKLDYL